MGDHQDDTGWRPPVIFALVALGAVIAYALWPNWQNYCPTGEEMATCSRQWVGALSGWVALAVGIPTVLFLSKQVADARRHHREAFALEVRRVRALALRSRRDALIVTSEFDVIWPDPKVDLTEQPWMSAEEFIEWNRQIFARDHFQRFEDEIDQLGRYRVDAIGPLLEEVVEYCQGTFEDYNNADIQNALGVCREYAARVVRVADAFLAEVDAAGGFSDAGRYQIRKRD